MTTRTPMLHTRVPEQLKKQLEESARVTGRSVNAEVVNRLERSFGRLKEEDDYSLKLVKISAIERELCSIDLIVGDLDKNPFSKRGIRDTFRDLKEKLEEELDILKS